MSDKRKCQQTEAYMNSFLDRTLVGDELCDFLNHVLACENCYEELETRFLLNVALGRVEEGKTIDLSRELSERIRYARRALRLQWFIETVYRCAEILAGILAVFYAGSVLIRIF